MRRIVVAVVALAVLVGAIVVGARLLTKEKTIEVTAVFSQTVGLYEGSDVRVLGVSVGTVTSVTPDGGSVKVKLDIDPDQKVAANTGAVVVAPSLVSDRFVQLTDPWVDGAVLQDGASIPEDRTAVPVELDALYQSLDDIAIALGPNGANKDGALSELISTGAANLEGNGADINKVLKEFGNATGTLADSDQDLFATVDNLDRFNEVLVQNDDAVSQVNAQFATVTQYLAEDRGDLAEAISSLGSSLAKVEVFIRDNRTHLRSSLKHLTSTTRLLDEQRKNLAEVLRTLPVTLQDFLGAYNPDTGRLDGRVDINELSIWASTVGSQKATAGGSGQGSADAPPPLLLPSVGESR